MPAKKAPKPISLNDEQQAVVSTRSGFWAVLAGPGSGKTTACVQRMVSLVQEGIDPNNLLALSFTKTAATNLRDRVEAITGKLSISRTAGSMTLHSLALRFAEEERENFSYDLAEFPLATEPVANKLAGESARRYEVDPRSLRSVVSVLKRERVRPAQEVRDAERALDPKRLKLALAYADYDKRLKSNGVLDFDSLMFEMVDILTKDAEVRSRWQYLYVTCDEAQDCAKLDWELLKLLTEKHGNLLCVGDPGQSVFGFRGAAPKMFLNMDKMFPGTKKLFLATNYRSSPQLVKFLKGIGPVPELAEKFTTPNQAGPEPEVKGFVSAAQEAEWVASQLKTQPKEDECALFSNTLE